MIFLPSGLLREISVKNSSLKASSSVGTPLRNAASFPVSLSSATRNVSAVAFILCQTFRRNVLLIWRETDLLDLYRLLCLLRSDTSEFKSIHIVCTHFIILLLLSCYFLHIRDLQVSHIVVLSTSGSFSLISHPNLPVRSVH